MNTTVEVYTIGHSNAPFAKIVQLLQKHDIKVLVDVRSKPRSRWVPWFNRQNLESEIPNLGIEYRYAGNDLGGLPADQTFYKPNLNRKRKTDPAKVADYDKIARQKWFQEAIDELLDIASRKRTAVMCAEEDPGNCHRSQLLGRTLAEKGVKVLHIRKEGKLEPQSLD
jgi:uncharacterized protein (DUF488 family)